MNPDLVAGARAMLAAQSEMPNLSAADADSIVHSYTGGKYGAQDAAKLMTSMRADGSDFVATALQGATANWADEGLNALHAGSGDALKLRDELFHADHKVLAPIVSLAGAVLPAMATGGGALVGSAGRAAAAGAAYGGASGAGAGETTADRVQGGAIGAVAGGVGGAVLGKVAGKFAESLPSAGATPAIARNLDLIEKTPSMQRLQGVIDNLNKEISGMRTTFPGAPASVEKIIGEKTGALGTAQSQLATATAKAAAPVMSGGEKLLAQVNKQYANDPKMLEVATSGLKKMFPDLVTETAPVAEKVAGAVVPKTTKRLALESALHFAIGNHSSGAYNAVRALSSAVMQPKAEADAVAAPAAMLSSRVAHGTGVGAAALSHITRSLFDE